MEIFRAHVLVCTGTDCAASNSVEIINTFNGSLIKHNLEKEIKVIRTDCFGACEDGPVVVVYPEGVTYYRVSLKDVEDIITEHLINGRFLSRLMVKRSEAEAELPVNVEETSFFKKQRRIALRNCGLIDPENIEEYIARDGYQGLAKALTTMKPADVINEVKISGLRGRGGGGFPTGNKWDFAAKQVNETKYVCCNADEGDPGAFMDRSILEGDPHSLIEAMALAAYAIGSKTGYVYVRAEYPTAVKRLKIAIAQAKEYGLLGQNILGTGFEFDMEIRLGAGAFVCGEETALLRSIEGKRGMPTPRPPFPAIKGLFGKPTILNNVETYANIPVIVHSGGAEFAKIGTDKSKGTKVFALGGKVNNVGLVEIPMGTTVREIVYDIGGGIPNDKAFKAVQTGGPSGGCIPANHLDTPIDYDNLIALGSMMGSGGMIVMDEDTCMVDIAKFFLEFTVEESCGKCAPCRIGTKRMLEILEKITSGKGELSDLDDLERLAVAIKAGSLCGLGQTAPNPVLSTLHYFKNEYISHVVDKKCECGVCKALTNFFIIADKCRKCGLCAKKCPVGCISGEVGKTVFEIDPAKCIKCGACEEACKFSAVIRK
ncbi:MAG: NADH-quinone oxidoreductase subunit NuoF [Eubacteriales bacterium]|nr:NADH-quinone oxidoreductase subunit NuoF [Eubacteriales bacterium]MDD4717789.1 NADH-quinone oxidoreductase subunit NuoF [Eubacteriales bacterium]